MTAVDSQLLEYLAEENHVVGMLLGLIREEQELLVQSRVQDMQPVIQHKAEHVAQLAKLAARRHALLDTHGCIASETGMQQWLERHPHPQVEKAWRSLLDQVRQAKEVNRTNGLLIHTQLNRNRAALGILSGGITSLDNLYGPNGQTSHQAPSLGYVVS